ncbi:MAG: thioredoxin-like domain-containing protein [Terracidiphilus sp.]|nr:thioredoxin-like domain-containing protein [Terracidiphilus sp.]
MSKLFAGATLVNHAGERVDPASLDGKLVGIYFSAHWCPPCRAFTPELAAYYTEQVTAGAPLEIVFLSSDRDARAAAEYFAGMPWKMLDFADRDTKDALSSRFGVRGIPTLVILDEKGEVLTKDGRSLVSAGVPVAAWRERVRRPAPQVSLR